MSWQRTPPGHPPVIPDLEPASLSEDARLVLLILLLSVGSVCGWMVLSWVLWWLTGFSSFS